MNKKLIGFKYISWQRVIIQEYAERKKNGKETARNTIIQRLVRTQKTNKPTKKHNNKNKTKASKEDLACLLFYTKNTNFASVVNISIF